MNYVMLRGDRFAGVVAERVLTVKDSVGGRIPACEKAKTEMSSRVPCWEILHPALALSDFNPYVSVVV
jgi:hypothetical protein